MRIVLLLVVSRSVLCEKRRKCTGVLTAPWKESHITPANTTNQPDLGLTRQLFVARVLTNNTNIYTRATIIMEATQVDISIIVARVLTNRDNY